MRLVQCRKGGIGKWGNISVIRERVGGRLWGRKGERAILNIKRHCEGDSQEET